MTTQGSGLTPEEQYRRGMETIEAAVKQQTDKPPQYLAPSFDIRNKSTGFLSTQYIQQLQQAAKEADLKQQMAATQDLIMQQTTPQWTWSHQREITNLSNQSALLSVQMQAKSIDISQAMSVLNAEMEWYAGVPGIAKLVPTMDDQMRAAEADVNARQAELADLVRQQDSITWRLGMMSLITYLPNTSLADIISQVQTPYSNEDLQYITASYNSWHAGMTGQQQLTTPEGVVQQVTLPTGEVGEQPAPGTTEQVVNALVVKPHAVPVGLDQLTSAEISKALTTAPQITAPTGLDAEDIRSAFGYEDLSQFESDTVNEIIKAMQDSRATNKTIADTLSDVSISSLSAWELTMEILTQPVLGLGDAAMWISDKYARPLTGLIIRDVALPAIRYTTAPIQMAMGRENRVGAGWMSEFDAKVAEARSEGDNWWLAQGAVYEIDDLPWWNGWTKFAAEVLLDPTTYIGFGFTSKILKEVPIVGKSLAGANDAFIAMSDAPFKYLAAKYHNLPKASSVIITDAMRQSINDCRVAMTQYAITLGKTADKLTPEEISHFATISREFVQRHPDAAHINAASKFGSWQRMTTYIELNELKPLLKKLGLSVDDISKQTLVDINKVYENTAISGAIFKADDASIVIAHLLSANSDDKLKAVEKFLADRLEHDADNIAKVFDPGMRKVNGKWVSATRWRRSADIIRDFGDYSADVVKQNLASDVYKFQYQMGLAGSFTKAVDGLIHWGPLVKIDQMITTPMARQYLLFTNLGPPNAIETFMRGAFAGHNLMSDPKGVAGWSGSSSPIQLYQRAFADLPNADYNMMAATESMAQVLNIQEMGLGYEKASLHKFRGLDRVFSQVPGLMKPAPIPGIARPVFGKQVPRAFRSALDWHEWWGDIGLRMRANYLLAENLKQLQKIAPDQMAALAKSVDSAGDLKALGIKTISEQHLDYMKQYALHMAIAGPDSVRTLARLPEELRMAKTKADMARLLAESPDLDEFLKQSIMLEVERNGLANIDESMKTVVSALKDSEIFKQSQSSKMYKLLTDELGVTTIEDVDHWVHLVNMVADCDKTMDSTSATILRNGVRRAQELPPAERVKHMEALHDMLESFLQENGDAQAAAVNRLRTWLDDPAAANITKRQRMQYMRYLDTLEQKSKLAIETRTKLNQSFKDLQKKYGKRSPEFWAARDAAANKIWDDHFINTSLIEMQQQEIGLGLSKLPIPRLTPPANGRITVSSVAVLWNTTDEGVLKGFVRGETTTLMPRESFVNQTLGRAKAIAKRQGVSAESLGFTRTDIGKVYDDLLRQLGLNPKYASELDPKLLAVENIRLGMHNLRSVSGIADEDVVKINAWVERVAQNVESTRIHWKPQVTQPLADTHFTARFENKGASNVNLNTATYAEHARRFGDWTPPPPAVAPPTHVDWNEVQWRDKSSGSYTADWFQTHGTAEQKARLAKVQQAVDALPGSIRGDLKSVIIDNHYVQQEIGHAKAAYRRHDGTMLLRENFDADDVLHEFFHSYTNELTPMERRFLCIDYMEFIVKNNPVDDHTEAYSKLLNRIKTDQGYSLSGPNHWEFDIEEDIAEDFAAVYAALPEYQWRGREYLDNIGDWFDSKWPSPTTARSPRVKPTIIQEGATGTGTVTSTGVTYEEVFDKTEFTGGRKTNVIIGESAIGSRHLTNLWDAGKGREFRIIYTDPVTHKSSQLGVLRMVEFDKFVHVDLLSMKVGMPWTEGKAAGVDLGTVLAKISDVAGDRPVLPAGLTEDGTRMMKNLEKRGYIKQVDMDESEIQGLLMDEGLDSDTAEYLTSNWAFTVTKKAKDTIAKQSPQPIVHTITGTGMEGISVSNQPAAFAGASSATDYIPPGGVPFPPGADVGLPRPERSWRDIRTEAMERTRLQYELDFTDYNNMNMVDSVMRMIFPFWTYESQRWPWIARTILQKPAVAHSIGLYSNETDYGYLHVPGTDFEINPFRGSVFMGGFARLRRKDYPSYYNNFPGLNEVIDGMGRFGFYPGVHISAPLTIFGSSANPNWAELYPAWLRTPLDAYMAAFPNSQAAKVLQQTIFPDRYRNYMIGLELGSMEGVDADLILSKKQQNIELTPEEQAAWNRALRKVSIFSACNEQGAIARFNPNERYQATHQAEALIEEITGLNSRQQKWVTEHSNITGRTLANYFPLGNEQYNALMEAAGLKAWSNVTLPMLPADQQEERARTILFWSDYEQLRNGVISGSMPESMSGQQSFLDIDQQFFDYLSSGSGLNGASWRTTTADLSSELRAQLDGLHAASEYADLPITREERMQYAIDHHKPMPTYSPMQELLWQYYSIKPEKAIDPETGLATTDWDTYWKKLDAMLFAMDDQTRVEFLSKLQEDWTPMRKLYWSVNRIYIRAYRNVPTKVAEVRYTGEQKAIIDKYNASNFQVRQQMKEQYADLINTYNEEVATARKNLRTLDPELDAWLVIFGVVSTPASPTGEQYYNELVSQVLSGVASEPIYQQAVASLSTGE